MTHDSFQTESNRHSCNAAQVRKPIDVWVDGLTFSVTGAGYFRLVLVLPKEKSRV